MAERETIVVRYLETVAGQNYYKIWKVNPGQSDGGAGSFVQVANHFMKGVMNSRDKSVIYEVKYSRGTRKKLNQDEKELFEGLVGLMNKNTSARENLV